MTGDKRHLTRVFVRNLNKKFRIDEKFIQKAARSIFAILKKRRWNDIDIILLSDRGIRSFNRRYKHKDRPTDVLSFDLGFCGEILISSDTALRNSALFNTSLGEEIVLYLIHGILHLAGYDDEAAAQKKIMRKKEERILKTLCARLNFSKVLMPR